MPTSGFEPAIQASERPQTTVLDHAAIGTGHLVLLQWKLFHTHKFIPTNCTIGSNVPPNCSHLQEATSVEDTYSFLYMLSDINGKYLYIVVSFNEYTVLLQSY